MDDPREAIAQPTVCLAQRILRPLRQAAEPEAEFEPDGPKVQRASLALDTLDERGVVDDVDAVEGEPQGVDWEPMLVSMTTVSAGERARGVVLPVCRYLSLMRYLTFCLKIPRSGSTKGTIGVIVGGS